MGLTEIDRKEIIKYRLERANDTLLDVELAIQNRRWNIAANRLYYACYYAAIALLLNAGYSDARTHNGVKTLLGLHYAKDGLINAKLMKAYRQMFSLRQTGDYDDMVILTADDILELFEPARQFIETIEKLISDNN